MELTIEPARAPTPDVEALVHELEAELAQHYPPSQRHGLAIAALFAPDVRFFVARRGGAAVGCGGVGLYTGYAEVKRMYARPSARGAGVAAALLAAIEATARAAGYRVLRLETGDAQRAAMRFYERSGFARRAAFGGYLDLPAAAIATSVFYEKPLA